MCHATDLSLISHNGVTSGFFFFSQMQMQEMLSSLATILDVLSEVKAQFRNNLIPRTYCKSIARQS